MNRGVHLLQTDKMKKLLLMGVLGACATFGQTAYAQTTITVFDTILYYDGYAPVVSHPVPAGVIRHRNDLYARQLSTQELQSIGTNLSMTVTIKAACDNYDRIGNVNLALVPKGATTYNPDSVKRIEIGRYITPFMNKNVKPDTVPYHYNISNVAHLLKEPSVINNYDIWAELEVFGVPYAAQTQVAGCTGRNDVFYGTLKFETDGSTASDNNNVLIPLSFKKNLNNYDTTATDTVGKTIRSISFDVANNLTDAMFVLITSNHGANQGGEEYNRRDHFVYFDNNLIYNYKPGRTSCEPFRKYNTQGNGIYSGSPRTDAQWQSFSNWCPGDVIDTRKISLGAVPAGNHTFKLTVPDAQFVGKEGYFPVSLYLQGKTSGILGISEATEPLANVVVYPNPVADVLNIKSGAAIKTVQVFNILGQQVRNGHTAQVDLSGLQQGVYYVKVLLGNNQTVTKRVVKN